MKLKIKKLLNDSSNKKILVIGDFMIDEFLIGSVERINPEAPVPILRVLDEKFVLGGAGNVVTNLLSLNTNVLVSTVIGDDDDVNIMKRLIRENSIPTDGIFEESNRKTSRKTRLISRHQHLIRYDRESIHDIDKNNEKKIIDYVRTKIAEVDAIIIEDYGKGVLTESLIREIIKIGKEYKKIHSD